MFIWCAYCQTLVGEKPPYFDTRVTHGACEACAQQLVSNEHTPFWKDERVEFYSQLEQFAVEGDLATCKAKVDEGLALGLAAVDLASFAVHGILTDVGERWERGEICVADEHRITRWCDTVLAILPRTHSRPSARPDLVGFMVPGNRHYLGPSLAQYFLGERGLSTNIVTPELPWWEMQEIVARDKPRSIALSSARTEDVPKAIKLSERFRKSGYEGRIFLTGSGVRRGETWLTDEIIALTMWEVAEHLQH